MHVTVRLFAVQREQLGLRALSLEVPDGATIAQAWVTLVQAHPVLAAAGASVRFARNAEYAAPDARLEEGDELAVIPPVAGGSDACPSEPARHRWVELTREPIEDALWARLRREIPTTSDGAVVVFTGRTRESPGTPAPGQEAEAQRHAGARVLALEYEAYEEMARATLALIADEVEHRWGVSGLAIVHRIGEVPLGETSVAVVAAAPHRDAAFAACRYAIDELKARAPIWKSERFADGKVWLGAPARTPRDEEAGA